MRVRRDGALARRRLYAADALLSQASSACSSKQQDAADLEVRLLREGSRPDVLLQGETQVRKGSALLTPGAASVLSSLGQAALSKGHGDGRGQVLVSLEHTSEDAQSCPIGGAARVDFPKIDLIDELRPPQALIIDPLRPRRQAAPAT